MYKTKDLIRVVGRNAVYLAKLDLVCKLDLVGGFKGCAQGEHLIEYAASRPDITFLVVSLLRNLLRAHVIWRAYMRIGKDGFISHHAA